MHIQHNELAVPDPVDVACLGQRNAIAINCLLPPVQAIDVVAQHEEVVELIEVQGLHKRGLGNFGSIIIGITQPHACIPANAARNQKSHAWSLILSS